MAHAHGRPKQPTRGGTYASPKKGRLIQVRLEVDPNSVPEVIDF
jgi:hypothetical protein